ncbi:MAG: flagellar protein FlaG [Clostridia bacterium]|nr:flagellar protein FlaG [Clostridia bacterium]
MDNVTGIISSSPIAINVDNISNTSDTRAKHVKAEAKQQPEVKIVESGRNSIQLEEKVRQINQEISGENRKIEFEIHEKTNTLIFKVFNKNTGELIKEFPSEKLLDMAVAIWEKYGLIIDKKV